MIKKVFVALFLVAFSINTHAGYSEDVYGILIWLGYSANDFSLSQGSDGIEIEEWTAEGDPPTEAEVEGYRKPYWADKKRDEIDAEQVLRSVSVVGFPMPQQGFALMEELYVDILIPAARKNIDEVDTPLWWGLRELRNNRNTLLSGLESWIADAGKTAEDIRDFDIAGWSGWGVPRPE